MTGATILNRLDKVRQIRPGSWIARCPAHGDKDPSLSIRETDDGKVLLKCFAGCSAADVVGAVSLSLRDLFPEPLPGAEHHRRRESANRDKIERSLFRELTVLRSFIGSRFSDRENAKDRRYGDQAPQFQPTPDEPWERELAAVRRIRRGIALLYGKAT